MEWKCLAKTFLDQALCSRVRAFSFRAGWGVGSTGWKSGDADLGRGLYTDSI